MNESPNYPEVWWWRWDESLTCTCQQLLPGLFWTSCLLLPVLYHCTEKFFNSGNENLSLPRSDFCYCDMSQLIWFEDVCKTLFTVILYTNELNVNDCDSCIWKTCYLSNIYFPTNLFLRVPPQEIFNIDFED